jgi:hypothetical protein
MVLVVDQVVVHQMELIILLERVAQMVVVQL